MADAGAGVDIWSGQTDGLQQNVPFTFQDRIFWEANQGTTVNKFKRFAPDAGVADFLTYEPDPAHGVGDLGTDGHDLVWLDGKGVSGSGLYDTNSIMTAPYTDDGAALVARRLRSEVANGFGVSPFVVGCGYAVRATLGSRSSSMVPITAGRAKWTTTGWTRR